MRLSTRSLFVSIFFIAIFVMATREIADPDFWWHLRAGQYWLEGHQPPTTDIFSFTNAGKPWIAHEWFSEYIIYGLYRLGGYGALILTFSAIIALSFLILYARCYGIPYFAAFIVLLAALATAPTWGVRPQIITLLFASLTLFALDDHRATARAEMQRIANDAETTLRAEAARFWNQKGMPPYILLFPLMALWANMHSGYALGIALMALYLIGELAPHVPDIFAALTRRDAPLARRVESVTVRYFPYVTFGFVFLLAILAVLANPYRAQIYVYPFETLASRAMQTYIQEWFSPDFHLNEFQPFAILLLATFASYALARRRARLTDVLLLLFFGYAALRSARNIPFFALVAAPILAANLWAWLEVRGWDRVFASNSATPRRLAILNWLILLLIVAASAARIATIIANQANAERARYPAAAVDYIAQNKLYAPMYNAYGWGGYLIWRLYPDARVYIDGRADVYGDGFIEEYLNTYRGGENWREPLERYGVRLILIEPSAPLVARLEVDAEWKRIYVDDQAVIYRKQ